MGNGTLLMAEWSAFFLVLFPTFRRFVRLCCLPFQGEQRDERNEDGPGLVQPFEDGGIAHHRFVLPRPILGINAIRSARKRRKHRPNMVPIRVPERVPSVVSSYPARRSRGTLAAEITVCHCGQHSHLWHERRAPPLPAERVTKKKQKTKKTKQRQ